MHKFSKINPNVSKSFSIDLGFAFNAATAIEGSMNTFLFPDLIADLDLMFGDHPRLSSITNNFFKASTYE